MIRQMASSPPAAPPNDGLPRGIPLVLVVDDDADVREALGQALEDEGFAVLLAEDGQEGFDLMVARQPDLVLLDLMMPRMSGWQLVEAVKKNPAVNKIPIFVLTAAPDTAGVQRDYPVFIKPIRVERMLRTIRGFLQPHAAR
jgi:CheY-like chemotaxis protein